MLGVRIRILHLFRASSAAQVKASQAKAEAKDKVQASKNRVHELEQSTKKLERELADTKVSQCTSVRVRGRACAFGTPARLVCARIMCACG